MTFAVVLRGFLLSPAGFASRVRATIMVDVAQLAETRLPAHLPVVGPPVPRQGNLTQLNISKQRTRDNRPHYDACLIFQKQKYDIYHF